MNALTPTAGTSNALMPTNLGEAMKLADLMSKAKLLPAAVQNPADAFLVINQAMRWGMDPFAVAQEVSVIQGKLMHSGKIVAAAVQSSGVLAGRLSYDYAGTGDDRTVIVRGQLRGEAAPREVEVRLKDARTQNKVWNTQPDQQLAYHGARVWARRYTPEVMLGVYSPEEFEPERDLPPARGPVITSTAAPAEPQRPDWDGMAWPICARDGRCEDFGDADSWQAEVEKRIKHVQSRDLLDDVKKRALIQAVYDANIGAMEHIREQGYGEAVEAVEAAFADALRPEQEAA